MLVNNQTPCARACNSIREAASKLVASGTPERDALRSAARSLLCASPRFCLEVMEDLGSWPSDEPELRALQAVYR